MKKAIQKQPVKTCRKYDDTLKQQALQMLRLGQSVPMVAQTLSIGEGVLYKWKQWQRPDVLDQEMEQLRANLKQVEAERDILRSFDLAQHHIYIAATSIATRLFLNGP